MNETSQNGVCSRCGAAITPEALRGLCPRCLMSLNVLTQTDLPGDTAERSGVRTAKSAPPFPAAIAPLFPQFEILECLGSGGMGAVYKARQPKLDRYVALKILLPERQGDAQFAQRFAREARALARLNHPAIVAVYDFGEAGSYPYLIMEYVEGLSLRQLLQRGKLAPEEALSLIPRICEALQFAHQQGIVHRDIKPENILLDKLGQVKIADFSIAKILAPGATDLSLTGGHEVVGTPHYMAPEQVEQPAKVDHRADIFSLGVVFYEMLTGELPMGKFAPPSQRVQVDGRLDEVVLRALEKDPERRYQQVGQVKTDVESITTTRQPARKKEASWTVSLASIFPSGELSWLETALWLARLFGLLLGLFAALIFSLILFGVGWPPLARQSGGALLNYLAIALMILGFMVGWRRAGAAAALIITGWALWHSSNGSLEWSMFHLALPVAAVYTYYWWKTQGRRTGILVTASSIATAGLVCGMAFLPTNVYLYGKVLDTVSGQPIPQAELALSYQPLFPRGHWLSWLSKWGRELMVSRMPVSPNSPEFSEPKRGSHDGYYTLCVGWYTPQKQVRITASGYAPLQVMLGQKPAWTRRIQREFVLSPLPR